MIKGTLCVSMTGHWGMKRLYLTSWDKDTESLSHLTQSMWPSLLAVYLKWFGLMISLAQLTVFLHFKLANTTNNSN